jgi:hypothetical protein
MDDMQSREKLLRQDMLLFGILGASILNGMHFSPWFDPAFLLAKPLFQITFWVSSPIIIFYFTSLVLSTLTIMLAGVPAAIFERLTDRKESDAVSLGIWLAAAVALSMPALLAAAHTTATPQ